MTALGESEPYSEVEFAEMICAGGVEKARAIEVKIKDTDMDKNRLLTYPEIMLMFK
jgi:hypothetical protein